MGLSYIASKPFRKKWTLEKTLKRELRSLDLLEKAVEEEIIERKDVQKHFGMTKTTFSMSAAGKFSEFKMGQTQDFGQRLGRRKKKISNHS